ncbi:SdrD B-like domain-containing protein [Roseiconus lacunae]|uniref:SdrD B-like domain-containing protein n=1 Tax=Roseiconus lacunae TaxID=2605694 RepID=UPI0011F2A291|nr:SdrD B-like domain-containing protein [Roseiconus lacunae]
MPVSPLSRFGRHNKNTRRRSRRRLRTRKPLVQPLEDRRVLALLGIVPELPVLYSNQTGSVSYDSATDLFQADATPLWIDDGVTFGFVDQPASFDLNFYVDQSGSFVSGVSGDDFVVTGSIDFDFDFVPDVSGVLLTGEVTAFGFADGAPTSTDFYNMRLTATGGALTAPITTSLGDSLPAYYAGKDIGISINSEDSSFTGSFDVDFSGGNKANTGPIEPDNSNPPTAELGNFVWVDTNYNGLQDDGPTGVNGVTVNLYQDVDGDGIAEPGGDDGGPIATTVTAPLMGEDGYYLFEELEAGDYFVEFDTSTIPTGFELTLDNQGGDDAVDSDADQVSGLATVTTLEDGESDLTWDAGIVQIVHPDIEIVKCVEDVIESSSMTVIDFDDLSKGDIVQSQYPGVTISATSRNKPWQGNAAMIFNSSYPTGHDNDLGTPNQAYGGPGQGSGGASNDTALGNVLIISEDGDQSDPDDDYKGGVITFSFDQPVDINHLDVLDIDVDEHGGSILTVTTTTGTQTIAISVAGNNSVQRIQVDVSNVVEMKVDFVSSGAITELKYSTSDSEVICDDANDAPGVSFDFGDDVVFNYHVTNSGDTALSPVTVTDDNATPGDNGDDFNPTPVNTSNGFNVGDTNEDGRLDPNEVWEYTATITASTAGQFTNIALVAGTPINDNGDVIGEDVTDEDPANYNVEGIPGIDIEKLTNGIDADTASDAVEIAAGDTVTWTYNVTNTGSTTFAQSEISVIDDAGTPGDASDDFAPTLIASSDAGSDGLLSPGEVWQYEASSTAQSVVSSGESVTLYLTGNTALDGPNGNVRTFNANGVSVSASAFSRSSGGEWRDAYLGAYSSGLGVTDRYEGDGRGGEHRVDNVGKLNYVLFEFSEKVVVNSAFLDSVIGDSDLSIWIGDRSDLPSSGLALSDAALSNMDVYETSMANNAYSRFANFNGAGAVGDVLILAAWVDDASPEDCFKIRKLKFDTVSQGVYGNIGTVIAGDVDDNDPSHYTNPAPAPSGAIGDLVWKDKDRDGKQDSDEPGFAGVTVKLYDDGGSVIQTTTTDNNGRYEFTGLPGGDYRVGFELPNDYVFTRLRSDISDSRDSDANRSTGLSPVISLEDHEIDHSVDAGIYRAKVDKVFEAEHHDWCSNPWRWKYDSHASGGKYLEATNGSGSYYNYVPHGNNVKYHFSVDSDGQYELSSLLKTTNGSNNSVWFRIDGGSWKEWHMPVTGHRFEWHAATHGWNQNSVTYSLAAGNHSLELKVREDGTRFDKFKVSKLETTTIVIDANAANSITGDWSIDVDDDGNEFLVAANGTGSHYNSPPAGDELTYEFSLERAGTFDMFALVSAQNGSDNSFWIQIDGGDWIEWHLNVTGDSFEWQEVTSGWNQDAVRFDLDAGNHTLKIKVREDGTAIDKIVISDDQFIDLSEY